MLQPRALIPTVLYLKNYLYRNVNTVLTGIYFSTIEFILLSSHISDRIELQRLGKIFKKSQKCEIFLGGALGFEAEG